MRRSAARRARVRSPRILRPKSLRFRGAVADAVAGNRRGGRRADAWRARRAIRAMGQPRAAGAHRRRQGGRRLGRRVVDRCGDRSARQAPLAQRPHRLYRAAHRRAARAARCALSEHRQSHARLYKTATDQIGGGAGLAAHRRAFHRSRHGGAARRLEAGIERARARRRDRARVYCAGRDKRYSLHRYNVYVRAGPRRAAAVCNDAPRPERRRRGGGDQRRVLGPSGAGAAQLCLGRADAALSRFARGG